MYSLCENKLFYKYNCLLDVATPGSCIKASPLMQPVTASPKGDLNTGVLLKIRKFLLYLYLEWKSSYCIYNKEFSSTSIKSFICTGPFP